ncbi:putative inorganic carbon transporter subunit DabA, partial [Reichenbachiella sp.]
DTEFLGGLHDTTRDEFTFYDEELLSPDNQSLHLDKKSLFNKALKINAKERSRRFASIDSRKSEEKIYKEVQKRSVSLFEPRPELNHATNALCIIGNKELNHHLFLDRRSFLNSYNYKIDPKGQFLAGILNAAAPVCGGINLEYYFSRVDNQRFGAGSKLPHNVMGLIGVANGFEGDLRTGLPLQMVEVHDPIRLLMIIEHFPEVVLKTIKDNPSTYEWFENEWVVLCVIHPIERTIHHFVKGEFSSYLPITTSIRKVDSLTDVFESQEENLPIYHIV